MKLIRVWKKVFCKLFKRKLKYAYNELLRDILLPTLNQEKKVSDGEISDQEVNLAMKSFSHNKSSGKDGLTKEFLKLFGTKWKNPSGIC